MNPLSVLAGLLVRGFPWAIVGTLGAAVGSTAVRGARAANVPAMIPGLEDDTAAGLSGGAAAITIQASDLAAGALGGPLLAVLLRPRPLGAFLGGLGAGAAAAALAPAEGPPVVGSDGSVRRTSR
ncbi:MAG: hypothetical protein MUC54_02215 [Chloroflexi bacterium]|jgi:hypothetical protein|nr:hypothetical protein [Chloroflexota bacterium]